MRRSMNKVFLYRLDTIPENLKGPSKEKPGKLILDKSLQS